MHFKWGPEIGCSGGASTPPTALENAGILTGSSKPKIEVPGGGGWHSYPPPQRRAPRGDLWQQTMAEKKTLVSVVSALQAAAGPETPPHLRRLVSQCQALMAAQPIVG